MEKSGKKWSQKNGKGLILDWNGRFEVKVDGKGRLTFPVHYRKSVQGQTLVLTNSFHQGKKLIDIYSEDAWAKLKARMSRLSPLNPKVASFQRFYLAGGLSVESDKLGRFLIPKSLRDYAELSKDTVLVGMGNKLELWRAEDWSSIFESMITGYEVTVAEIANLEIGMVAS